MFAMLHALVVVRNSEGLRSAFIDVFVQFIEDNKYLNSLQQHSLIF